MSYGIIKKESFDVLSYRISIILNFSFDVFFGSYFLFSWIYYGKPQVNVIVVMFIVPFFLLFITLFIYFITKKTVIFSVEKVVIDNYEYAWHSLNMTFNSDKIPPIWNTIRITYYDYKKSSTVNIYIKCKKNEYDVIMSIRN